MRYKDTTNAPFTRAINLMGMLNACICILITLVHKAHLISMLKLSTLHKYLRAVMMLINSIFISICVGGGKYKRGGGLGSRGRGAAHKYAEVSNYSG